MVKRKLGIIGLSKGNGHPFSFSAIINGFNDRELEKCGWPVIYNYVRRRHKSEFGFEGVKVTHAWTQDVEITKKLCGSCFIDHTVTDYKDMVDEVDAVIIARDDYETHYEIASYFLERKKPVFIDKPLTLNVNELQYFKPFLENGQLMSCSAMRYAYELDEARTNFNKYGKIKLFRGVIVNDWERYGVHLIDAIFNVTSARPKSIFMIDAIDHTSVSIKMDDGSLFQINTLGEGFLTFKIDIFGENFITSHDIVDNFTMFRRTIWEFIEMINRKEPVIPSEDTIMCMKTLIAGKISKEENREVSIDEIDV